MARIALDVLSGEVTERTVTNRQTGEMEKSKVYVLHGLDRDFPESMFKVQVWRDYDKILTGNMYEKGAVIEIKFKTIRPVDNKFVKVPEITASQDDIKLLKTAHQAVKEQLESMGRNGEPVMVPAEEETQ